MSGTPKKLRLGAYLTLALLGAFGVAQRGANEVETETETETEVEEKTEPAAKEGSLAGQVVVVSLRTDDLSDGERLRAFRQLLTAADDEEATALVFEINTRAGYDAELATLLLQDLPEIKTPIYSLAKPSALGMGALLALGSNAVYVSPVAFVGGATPDAIRDEAGKLDEPANARMVSILRAQASSIAAAKGQRPELAEAFINAEFELRLTPEGGGKRETITTSGEVLTLTADQAIKTYEGKPLLAKGTVETVEELVAAENLDGEVFETTAVEWSQGRSRAKMLASESKSGLKGGDKAGRENLPFGKLPEEDFGGRILVMKVGLDDLMSDARFRFTEEVLNKAKKEGASALIFDMHTPGGYVWQTTDLMLGALQNLPFPTYTFVNNKAKSGGAMVAIATDHIYMKPTSTIGSALPVSGTGGDIPEDLLKKVRADLESTVKNIAVAKNHDVDLCIAFIRDDTRIVRDGVVLCDVGEVLDLNAVEATQIYDGRPLLAKGLVDSVEEIIELEGLEGEILKVRASPLQAFAQWTQIWGFILITFGFVGAYIEFNSPGFGVPGLVSILAFGTFFFGNYAAGNLAGWETGVVFVIGLVLVILDLFVFSGTIVLGVLGAALMVGSLAVALVNRYDLGEYTRGAADTDASSVATLGNLFTFPLLSLSIAIILTVAIISLLMRYLPGIKPVQWLILQTAVPTGTSAPGAVSAAGGDGDGTATPGSAMLGKRGAAETDLRPTGRARIAGDLLDVTTESEFIPRGAKVKVIAVQGTELVVTAA